MSLRKRVIDSHSTAPPISDDEQWMDVARVASAEVTSEDPKYPLESALLPASEGRWRAARPGEQIIRLVFDEPRHLRRIELVFDEPDVARTQEFVLRWSPDGGRTLREIVRQQWNFSPGGSTRQVEQYRVDVLGATLLELAIVPDISGGDARASLTRWRVA